MSDIIIEALFDKRKLVEAEFNEKLKQIDAAIQEHRVRSLRHDKGPSDSTSSAKANFSLANDVRIRSVNDMILKTIDSFDGNFTLNHMKLRVKQLFPHLYSEKIGKGIGPRLWEASTGEKPLLKLIVRGRGGKPNIYARIDSPAQ